MARQSINVGFPAPNFVSETGNRQAILPGAFISETSATTTVGTGWSVVLPDLRRRTPVGVASADRIQPVAPTVNAAAAGWNVVLPDLPAFRRKQALPEGQGRLDQPAAVVTAVFVEGWSIVLPNLPAFRRFQALPEATGRLDQPTAVVTVIPVEGWAPVLPNIRRPPRIALVGADPIPSIAPLVTGWNIVLPDFPKARRLQAMPEGPNELARPIIAPAPTGWSIVLPALPAPHRFVESVESNGAGWLTSSTILAALGTSESSGSAALVITIPMSAAGTAETSGYGTLSGFPSFALRDAGASADPLWVAVEVDLWDSVNPQNLDGTTTLRLSNRGTLTRNVAGVLYQYLPRLKTPFQISSTLTIFSGGSSGSAVSMFQSPLRGQGSGSIEWAIDPDFANWLNPGRYRWYGRTVRVYEGITSSDIGVDVDANLTLIYTGSVDAFTFNLTATEPSASLQFVDPTIALDKSLVDDFYDTTFPTSLQGKPRPQLFGRALSLEPVLEDNANIVYRVSRAALDDITEVRVGGVPWQRVVAGSTFVSPSLAPTLANLFAQYDALPISLQNDYNGVVGSDPGNFNNGPGLQNKVNLVALLTAYNALSASQQNTYNSTVGTILAGAGVYNNSPAGITNKLTLAINLAGSGAVIPSLSPTLPNLLALYAALPPSLQAAYDSVVGSDPANFNNTTGLQNKVNLVVLLTVYGGLSASAQTTFNATVSAAGFYNNTPAGIVNKFNLIKSYYQTLPAQGQWAPNLANGTFQLGSPTLGGEVRVDAQAIGWGTLDLATLIKQICASQGVATDPTYMAQLHLDWPGLTYYYTGTSQKNCLDALDEITLGNLCWWSFGPNGSVIAGQVSGPELARPDYLIFGSHPDVPFDSNLLGSLPFDPIPKEISAMQMTQMLPPAWRARIEYARNWNPATQFYGAVTNAEQQAQSAPGVVLDWSVANAGGGSGFLLSPSDGTAILKGDPKAQDLYIKSLAWRGAEASSLRSHLVQNVTGTIERSVFDVSVRMRASQIKPFQSVAVLWVDANDRTEGFYGGIFRVTSRTLSIGGGAQQMVLWGASYTGAALRFSSYLAPPVGLPQTPVMIGFTVLPVDGSALAGTVVATVMVTTSNGLPFAGSYGFAPPNNNAGGDVTFTQVTVTQVNIVLTRALIGGDGGAHNVTVSATENGVTVSNSFTFNVTPTPTGPGPPTSTPVLSLIVTPSAPKISPTTPLGAVVATLRGVWSDGSPFTGSYQFVAPNFNAGGVYEISGNNLIVSPSGPGVSAAGGSTEDVTLVAIQ